MSKKTKGRTGWHQATPKTSSSIHNFTGLPSYIKAAIVPLALLGLLTVGLANWIVRRSKLKA